MLRRSLMINHYLVEGATGGPPLSAQTGAPDFIIEPFDPARHDCPASPAAWRRRRVIPVFAGRLRASSAACSRPACGGSRFFRPAQDVICLFDPMAGSLASDTRNWGHIREVWLNPENDSALTTEVA